MNEKRKKSADWIAVDWGTSNLRYWVIFSNELLHYGHKPLGMTRLTPEEYEKTIIDEIDSFLDPLKKTPLLICGMAGSRQGWREAPYLNVPCEPPKLTDAIDVKCEDPRIVAQILPGIKQQSPEDIMRGEETQIVGILSDITDFDGVICLPGTHTKWVRISAGEIVCFQTFMTGELFSLLSENSVLKHSISKHGWSNSAFLEGVNEALSDPKLVSANLFRIRANHILKNTSLINSCSRLSGLLIGLELAGAKPYWLGQNIYIAAQNEISKSYKDALSSQGVEVQINSDTYLSLKGLQKIRNLDYP